MAFLDLETTGLDTASARVVELAVIRVSPEGETIERFRRFNPGIPIPPEASEVHGITDADVADEPPFSSRARSLAELLDPCDLAGFNLRRFDLPILLAEFGRSGVPFDAANRRLIDVQTIFHREEPRHLSAAAKFYLGKEHEEAHTALGDTRTTAAVFGAQLRRYPHLPQDLGALHAYCDESAPFETEAARWFAGSPGAYRFRRGKHRGRPLAEVAEREPDYLEWMLGAENIAEEVRRIAKQALEAK